MERTDWHYKLVMLVSMVGMAVVGIIEGENRNKPGHIYDWLFDYLFTPINQTMFALLAFYIASAAFRAFRARNSEATVLLGAACVVMLAQVPLGENLPFIGEYLLQFKAWLLNVPNVAARRAIFAGRLWGPSQRGFGPLGIERSHLGGDS